MSWLRTARVVVLLLAVAGAAVAGAATPADVLIVAVSGDAVSVDPPFSSGAPFQNEVMRCPSAASWIQPRSARSCGSATGRATRSSSSPAGTM